jgi:hypothetical protein
MIILGSVHQQLAPQKLKSHQSLSMLYVLCIVKIIPSFTIHLLSFCEFSISLSLIYALGHAWPIWLPRFFTIHQKLAFLIVCYVRNTVDGRGLSNACVNYLPATFALCTPNSWISANPRTRTFWYNLMRAATGIAGAAVVVLLKCTCVLWGRPRFLFSLLIRPAKSQ